MFVVRLVFFPVKVGAKTTKMAAKTGYRTGRLLGYRRLFVFGLGIAVGVLIAPGPGRELREKIKAILAGEATLEPEPLLVEPPVVTVDRTLTVTGTNGHN
jgi:hypothetical protein